MLQRFIFALAKPCTLQEPQTDQNGCRYYFIQQESPQNGEDGFMRPWNRQLFPNLTLYVVLKLLAQKLINSIQPLSTKYCMRDFYVALSFFIFARTRILR
mmetsp:Transcript_42729/g.72900  ORF Transcript_42729/g.72900 Transcript_42729/m.72900 type:complete len:100 (+) Transcript_42729:369-668(+)